ncbi:MAG: acyl-CoA dehydrogenase family protein [Chloroflexi bacterium]|nr:acyl-CoA dehydrogenase family protein [Chloroflexota bacterium]
MEFRFTIEQEAFRQEVRQFLRERWEPVPFPERNHVEISPKEQQLVRQVAEKGWLAMGWPVEYGGQGRSFLDQFIWQEELGYAGAWFPDTALNLIGPTLIRVGTEEQKRDYLPPILKGEIEFALGYTEPTGGSDLAALQTRAVEDGDDYVINGQKMFTSAAHYATHIWLLARTDPTQPKHRGLSVFIVPMQTEGVLVRPLWTIGNGRTNEVFFDNVRVSKRQLIGEKNRGWYHVAMALDFERVSGAANWYVRCMRALGALVQWAQETSANGSPLSRNPVVRQKLAELAEDAQVARLFAYRDVWLIEKGMVPNYEASSSKVWSSELHQRIANVGTQLMGLYGQLQTGSPHAPVDGKIEWLYRATVNDSVGAGTNQIQRNVIATRGLGLPRG